METLVSVIRRFLRCSQGFFLRIASFIVRWFHRTYKSATKLLSNPARGIIDGELVWLFLGLPTSEKQEVAKKIGTKVDEIADDLADIERLTAHF